MFDFPVPHVATHHNALPVQALLEVLKDRGAPQMRVDGDQVRDITTDPVWEQRFGLEIPVLSWVLEGGREVGSFPAVPDPLQYQAPRATPLSMRAAVPPFKAALQRPLLGVVRNCLGAPGSWCS